MVQENILMPMETVTVVITKMKKKMEEVCILLVTVMYMMASGKMTKETAMAYLHYRQVILTKACLWMV